MHIKVFSSLTWAPWGGSEILWSRTAAWLAARGVKVTASVHGWPETPKAVKRLRESGVVVWERHSLLPSRWQRLMWKWKLQARIDPAETAAREWLVDGRPDLVCFSDGAVAYMPQYLRYCREAGIPYVNVAQANSEGFWPVDAVADEQFTVLAGAQRCFFVSEGNLKLCELQLGHRLCNAEVVRNPFGVDYDVRASWPENPHAELSLACVGRLEPTAKGQDLLFQVLAMQKWRSRSVAVTLYGTGPMARSVQRMAAMLELGEAVHFGGVVDNVEEVWRRHHALILPSRCEGLPIAAVEAMLCHRAVITTDVAGNAEIVEDGVTGFIATAPKVEALDQALEKAWQNRQALRDMGLRAGRAIRLNVPREPERVFAERLMSLIGEKPS